MKEEERIDGAQLRLDNEFVGWVASLKNEIRNAQIKAAVRVNSELLHLYWHLGAEICEKQKTKKWGDGWLEELSRELLKEFPLIKGFSLRNLQLIRQWYLFYNQDNIITKQVVSQLQEVFFSVPWGHHVYIIQRCDNVPKALFFLRKTVENGWSRAVLLNFLDTDLYERFEKAVNNFERVLPEAQSDLAKQTLKDPYNFDFLTLTDDYHERELEDALTQNLTQFLLELGKGFAYVGRQVPLEVGNETIFVDLLFYHLELRCYVVIELKTTKFRGEHLGQLGLYVSAVNHLRRRPEDNPTIGLLVCKTKDNVMAQYSLETTTMPIGISGYELSELIPDEVKSKLPTVEELEKELETQSAAREKD